MKLTLKDEIEQSKKTIEWHDKISMLTDILNPEVLNKFEDLFKTILADTKADSVKNFV
jgi:hypothetical protein